MGGAATTIHGQSNSGGRSQWRAAGGAQRWVYAAERTQTLGHRARCRTDPCGRPALAVFKQGAPWPCCCRAVLQRRCEPMKSPLAHQLAIASSLLAAVSAVWKQRKNSLERQSISNSLINGTTISYGGPCRLRGSEPRGQDCHLGRRCVGVGRGRMAGRRGR
jgi:hypothetical protein